MIIEYDVNTVFRGYNILFFYSSWSSTCTVNENILNDLNKKYKDIGIIKINTTKFYDLKKRYDINRIPSYLLVSNGKEISRYSGGINLKFLEEWLRKYIR